MVLCTLRQLPWNLERYDQAKQAFVSYQMIGGGDWWYQQTPDGDTATKPPLAGWISAALYPLTGGHWFAAWIVPSFASALVLLWLLDRGACRLGRESEHHVWTLRTVALAAFGLNLMTPHLATLVRTDMPLALLLFIPGYLIWRKQQERQLWTGGERVVFALAVLASMMTKGPLIGIFVVPGMAACWWLQRRQGEHFHGWAGWWPWLLPLAGFLAWTGAGILWHPGFYAEVVVKEFAGRVTGVHHSQPAYYYLWQLLIRILPWSVLLAVMALARRGRELARQRPEVLWLACWTLGALFVMSLIPSKRTDRIFPVVPPACLWLVSLLAHWKSERFFRWPMRRLLVGCVITAAFFSSIYAGAKVHEARHEDHGGLVRFAKRARVYADQRGWALAVAGSRDEGLPMYAGVEQFLSRRKIIGLWRDGAISGVVIAQDRLGKYCKDLPGSRVLFKSPQSVESGKSYVFVGRGG